VVEWFEESRSYPLASSAALQSVSDSETGYVFAVDDDDDDFRQVVDSADISVSFGIDSDVNIDAIFMLIIPFKIRKVVR